MWLTDLAENLACPSPTKKVGQPEILAAVGLSLLSHLSHSKTGGAKPNCESKSPAPADELDAIIDEKVDGFAFPLDGEPLPCIACTCWQRVPGLAWWCGRCAATGRSINTRSVCDCGFVDWQAAPVELRTAPQQQGEAGAEAVEATACAY